MIGLRKEKTLLDLRGVTRVFRTGLYLGAAFRAVDDVSFCVREKTCEIIAGESGSGKSTLAKMVLGILKPSAGEVFYKGRNIFRLRGGERKEFKREVQPVFQDPFETFNPFRKVTDYLEATALNFGMAKSRREAIRLIDDRLQRIGMDPHDVHGKFPHEFSGGQLQRLSIARALMANPRLLVADEPVSMVDASVRVDILALFVELMVGSNMSVIYITHDLSTAYYLGVQTNAEIIIMYRGECVEKGSVEEVLINPLHPYSEMLLDALPEPNPQRKWTSRARLPSLTLKEFRKNGCKFAERCQRAAQICFEKRPPLSYVDNRAVRCWVVEEKVLKEGHHEA